MSEVQSNRSPEAKAWPAGGIRTAGSTGNPNTGNHLAQRRAVSALRARQSVVVATRTFGPQGARTRVLVSGEMYDVDEIRLAQLRAGLTPSDLSLESAGDEDE